MMALAQNSPLLFEIDPAWADVMPHSFIHAMQAIQRTMAAGLGMPYMAGTWDPASQYFLRAIAAEDDRAYMSRVATPKRGIRPSENPSEWDPFPSKAAFVEVVMAEDLVGGEGPKKGKIVHSVNGEYVEANRGDYQDSELGWVIDVYDRYIAPGDTIEADAKVVCLVSTDVSGKVYHQAAIFTPKGITGTRKYFKIDEMTIDGTSIIIPTAIETLVAGRVVKTEDTDDTIWEGEDQCPTP